MPTFYVGQTDYIEKLNSIVSNSGIATITVANSNGLAGTSSGGPTPILTLSTTITGLLKGSGSSLAQAINADLPSMTSTVGGAVPTPPNDITRFLSGSGTWLVPLMSVTWAAPGAIGSTTPNTGNFTSLSASGNISAANLSGTNTGDQINISGSATGLSTTLVVASGGTGTTTLATNGVVLGNGTSAVQTVLPGTAGNVLTSNGTTWSSSALPTRVVEVLGTSPIVSSGGTSPVLSIIPATTSTAGSLSSTDKLKINKLSIPLKIVVLGDSLSNPQTFRTVGWAELLESMILQTGTPVHVQNIAIGGSTFHSAYTLVQFGTNTMVEQCIESNPDIVLVMLGANDATSPRTLAQIKADALDTVTALRAALPLAKLVFINEIVYDDFNFTTETLKVKGVIPYLFDLPSSGITAGTYCTEMLDTAASSAVKTACSNLSSLNTYTNSLPQWDLTFSYNHWKASRLGCMLFDRIHPNSQGNVFMASAVIKGLASAPFAEALYPGLLYQYTNIISAIDPLFEAALTHSGDGYTSVVSASFENATTEFGVGRQLHPDTWIYPYKSRHTNYPLSIQHDKSSIAHSIIQSATPYEFMYISINGNAWVNTNIKTDGYGFGIYTYDGTNIGIPGTYTLRFKVGIEVFGPYTQTVTSGVYAPIPGSSWTIDLNNGTTQKLTTNANTSIVLPTAAVGRAYTIIVAYGGVHTITFSGGGAIKWENNVAPIQTKVNGKYDIYEFTSDGTVTYGRSGGLNY